MTIRDQRRQSENKARWDLAWKLRILRREMGFSTRGLAHRLGVAQGTISRWETGDRTPTDEKSAAYLAFVRPHLTSEEMSLLKGLQVD